MARGGVPGRNARFFCEQCGAEVRAGAQTCPSCGSRFTAVRCPRCGYEGAAPEFRDGCPVCGYAAGLPQGGRTPPGSLQSRKPGRRKGIPVLFSRLAIAVLTLVIVVLVAVLLLSK